MCLLDEGNFLAVEVGDFVGLAVCVGVEDGFHGFDGGDGLSVCGEVGVLEFADLPESLWSLALRAAEFDEGGFACEAFDHFDAISAL